MVKIKNSRQSDTHTIIAGDDSVESSQYRSIDWTWSKIISVCLLGSLAFYSTHQIAWDSIKAEHIIAQPSLNNDHYNNILKSEITSHLQKSRRSVQENQVHKLHESNSAMPSLDFSLYEPIEAVESHEIHKRAIEIEEDEEGDSRSKLQKFYYEDYVNIPLNKLETIKITNGKNSITFYQQGTQVPPSDMSERDFMITKDQMDFEHLLVNAPELKKSSYVDGSNMDSDYEHSANIGSVKKFHASDKAYDNEPIHYYNRDGSDQVHFLDRLAQSGAIGAYNNLEDIIDDLYKSENGRPNPRSPPKNRVRYVASELPCLQTKKEPTFEQWLKQQDDAGPFARSFAIPTGGNGNGGGFGNKDDKPKEPAGKPVGCCNGRPYSAKKRCCCRRKSYDTESEFCCVSAQGCAAFQTFKNTTENRDACLHIGGNIVLNEYFDYQATPMIGWAAGRPYGPAYSSAGYARSTENEVRTRYNDVARGNGNTRPGRPNLNYDQFKVNELGRMTEELLDKNVAKETKFRTPNARGSYLSDLVMSADHINDLRAGNNPFPGMATRGH